MPVMEAADWLVTFLTLYATTGLAFAVPFALIGVQRLDPQARGSSPGFRLIIIPGALALWPLLLYRWIRGDSMPPEERNAHRNHASHGELP